MRIPTLVTTSQDCEVFRSNLLYIANPDGDALRDHADTIVEGTKKLLLALHNPQVCHIAKVTPLVSTLSPSACHCCWDLGESLWMRPRGSLRRGSRLFFFYIRFISYINVWTFGFNDIICSVNCIQLIIRFYVVRIHSSWDKGICCFICLNECNLKCAHYCSILTLLRLKKINWSSKYIIESLNRKPRIVTLKYFPIDDYKNLHHLHSARAKKPPALVFQAFRI